MQLGSGEYAFAIRHFRDALTAVVQFVPMDCAAGDSRCQAKGSAEAAGTLSFPQALYFPQALSRDVIARVITFDHSCCTLRLEERKCSSPSSAEVRNLEPRCSHTATKTIGTDTM